MRLRILFGLLLVALFLGATATGEPLPSTSPEAAGFAPDKLAAIDAAMQRYVDEKKLSGIITLIARGGKIVHVGTHGRMDVEADKPMRRDAILRFYSMSKPITSTALLTLYEQGRFELDDPVGKYLPEFKGIKVREEKQGEEATLADAVREMTIRDLMRHTSGLTYGFFSNSEVDRMYREAGVLDRSSDLAQMVSKLGKIPLLYQPGKRWHYSVAVDVQGRLIEVLSGESLDDFFRQRIFEPLAMHDTGFHVPSGQIDRFAANYGPGSGGGLKLIDPPSESRYLSAPGLFSGGGGLVSTADDYARFAQMLLDGGELDGARILKPDTVELMTRNHVPEALVPIRLGPLRIPHTGFGLGVSVRVSKDPDEPAGAVGEYGWAGAASTFFYVSPKEDFVALALTQFMPISFGFGQEFRGLVYEALSETAATAETD